MNNEANRLNTFNNWPSSAPVDPIRIAKAGFFYTGEGTEVQCFSCGGKISEWNYGDQVMSRHRLLEPNCEFVVNAQQSGNIPLILGRECSNLETPSLNVSEEEPEITEPSDYGLREEDEMYRSDALRLLSFVNWDDTSVTREALVNAGFYHVGQGRLRCAWCGGELAPFRNFGSIGHPLEVHRMYFPRCTYSSAMIARTMSEPLGFVQLTPPPPLPSQVSAPSPAPAQQSSAAAHNERVLSSSGTWRALGVVGSGARHPAYAALAARLATFDPPASWPADRAQTPRALANAGFFYTGTDDQVRCFYCDGGLGKWESGDAPWSEHARWFPHCGYVLLVKGQSFVDACRSNVQRCVSAENVGGSVSVPARGGAPVPAGGAPVPAGGAPVPAGAADACLESAAAGAALAAGLDAARVKRAIARRHRTTGLPFTSSEALIDAVLNEQLNEEAWSVNPQSQRLARDILAETLRDFAPRTGIIPTSTESIERRSPPLSPSSSTTRHAASQPNLVHIPPETQDAKKNSKDDGEKKLTLEEENRQLKEARLCKVCMDSEVSVVFLPCGHLVSCGGCGAALAACPLCRAAVRALVRAYLA